MTTDSALEWMRERWERTLDVYGPKRHRKDYPVAGQLTEAAETVLALLTIVEAAQELAKRSEEKVLGARCYQVVTARDLARLIGKLAALEPQTSPSEAQ